MPSFPSIPAVGAIAALPALPGPLAGPLPKPGEVLSLRLDRQQDGQWLASTPQGLRLLLPLSLGQESGQSVLLRVLSNMPRLLLLPLPAEEAPAAASAGKSTPGPAMLLDQARVSRWKAAAAEPLPVLAAAHWRAELLARTMAEAGAVGHGSVAVGQELVEPVLHLPGWGLTPLLLRMVGVLVAPWPQAHLNATPEHAAPDDEGGAPFADESPSPPQALLCLSLIFEGVPVQLLLHWQQGLFLHFSCADATTLEHLRQRLPHVAQALAGVPIKLRQCLLSVNQAALVMPDPAARNRVLGGLYSDVLFRAAAEIAKVLGSADARLVPGLA